MPIMLGGGTVFASTASHVLIQALQCVDLEVVRGIETVDQRHVTRLCIHIHRVSTNIKTCHEHSAGNAFPVTGSIAEGGNDASELSGSSVKRDFPEL